MAKLFKLFCDGAVKKAFGKLHAYTAEGDDGRFCIKIFPTIETGDYEGYVLRLSLAEARKLQRQLGRYLSEEDGQEPTSRDDFKAMEQAFMAIKEQYAEVARALGFDGDPFFGDPFAKPEEVVKRANYLMDTHLEEGQRLTLSRKRSR